MKKIRGCIPKDKMLLRIKLFWVKRALVIPTLILFSCLQRHNMRSWGAGGKGDGRGWDGWMASPTRWTWVCVNSGSWWWTGRPGVLQFMGSQRVGHDWAAELNWNLVYQTTVTVPLYFEVIDPLMALFHFRKIVLHVFGVNHPTNYYICMSRDCPNAGILILEAT